MNGLFDAADTAGKTKALVCFPYGGGWSSIFHPWEGILSDDVALLPVQFPGRGARMDEPSYTSLDRLTADTAQALSEIGLPLYMYGGCFGGMCAYETARVLEQSYGIRIKALFLNSLFAPQLIDLSERIGGLPHDEFIAKIREKGELPDEVLDDEEVLGFLLDGIIDDYRLYESYVYRESPPLGTDMHLFCKSPDEMTDRRYLSWKDYIRGGFDTRLIETNNIFGEQALGEIALSVSNIIKGV